MKIKMSNEKPKSLHAWQKFMLLVDENNGNITMQECLDKKIVKDKKAFYNTLYTLRGVKRFISYTIFPDGSYEVCFNNDGLHALNEIYHMQQPEQNDSQFNQDDNVQDDNVEIVYNGQVVHAFKKDEVVRFLDFLDDIITDFALVGLCN